MRTMLAIGLLLGTSACAEVTSIYHTREVPADKARIVTMDAKQRSILMVPSPSSDPGSKWRMCAEAAPDAFSALSASGSLAADIKSQSGKAAAALAETAGTIERTQTINLLRESMYRTCERYLSGALTWDQFIIQAARDQKSMVAVLAIEQLTRTARGSAVILTPAGTSSTIGNGEEQAALIADFAKERADAKTKSDEAGAAYEKIKANCKAATIPAEGATNPSLAEWTTCNEARTAKSDRAKDYDAATARLDKILTAVDGTGAAASAGTVGVAARTGEAGTAPSDTALSQVARSVENIALATGIDEALMFCIAHLGRTGPNPDVVQTCVPIIKSRADQDLKLRGNLLYAGPGLTVWSDPPVSNPARDRLRAYVASSVPAPERQRRWKILHKAAATMRIRPEDVAITIDVGDPGRVDALLAAAIAAETETAGRTALTAPR